MAYTYEPIATQTLGSSSATVTFGSIPSTYTHLRIVTTYSFGSVNRIGVRFNSDSGTNYSNTWLTGSGSAAESFRETSMSYIFSQWSGVPVTNPSLTVFDIFNYGGSTNKTVLVSTSGDQNGSGRVERGVGLWRSTSAITSLTVNGVSQNFTSGSSFTLFGIKAA